MNAIEFLSNPGDPCAGAMDKKAGIEMEVRLNTEQFQREIKECEASIRKLYDAVPQPGFWARVFGRRSAAAAESETAALRRRLVARDEQIEVLKNRVQSLREDLGASRSARLKAEVHLHLMTGTIERLEPVTIRHRNRAAHYERRFVELQAELAKTREELAVSEAARLDMIAE